MKDHDTCPKAVQTNRGKQGRVAEWQSHKVSERIGRLNEILSTPILDFGKPRTPAQPTLPLCHFATTS